MRKSELLRGCLIVPLLILCFLNAFGAEGKKLTWRGVFTVDDLPRTLTKSTGCRVVDMGSIMSNSYMFILDEYDKPLSICKNCYLNKIDDLLDRAINNLKKSAQKAGFNAILGLRVIIASHFDGFKGNVINNRTGIGYGYIRVMGTPVVIKCQSKK